MVYVFLRLRRDGSLRGFIFHRDRNLLYEARARKVPKVRVIVGVVVYAA